MLQVSLVMTALTGVLCVALPLGFGATLVHWLGGGAAFLPGVFLASLLLTIFCLVRHWSR